MAKVELQYEGQTHNIEVNEDESILEAGLREGLDLPYSCMSGICTACLAIKLEGEIEMEDAEAIDEDEIAEGKVLTCCAFVKSDTAKINYDEDE